MPNPRCNVHRDEEEAGAALRTIDCLRARLLAERQASRAAKEQSRLMSDLLVELEKMLKEETRQRDKTQKRLQFLDRKLESIRSHESERILESCSVPISAGSSTSTTNTIPFSFTESPHEEQGERSKPQFKINNLLETTPSSTLKGSASCLSEAGSSYGDDFHPDREQWRPVKEEGEEEVDNTLAIVLATAVPDKEMAREAEGMIDHGIQAREALETLRVAKASIQRATRQQRQTNHMMVAGTGAMVPPPPSHYCATQIH